VPIANNVYTDNDTVSDVLFRRGIVDVVENNVNWGGALAAASELYGYDEDNVATACIEAFHKTLALLNTARRKRCSPWQVLRRDVQHRVFNSTHPIHIKSRDFAFIGNIEADFAVWLRSKWLRGIVDKEGDEFATAAVALLTE